MNKTVLTFFTILCLLSAVFLMGFQISVEGSPELHVHNIDTGLDYATIQEAIDASETEGGHTVFVEEGIYYEHVVVNKTIFLIGENRSSTVIDGNNSGTSVMVWSSNVTVSGFTIRNGDDFGVAVFSHSCVIHNNIITNNQIDGVIILGYDNLVTDNIILYNYAGINLSLFGGNNTISGNIIASNLHCGVGTSYVSYDNKIFNNNFINNPLQAGAASSNAWDNGYPSGGNYWSDYNGTDLYSGSYQNETGYDWIGDTPYIINENNQDNYPLIEPYVPELQELRVAFRNLLSNYIELQGNYTSLNLTYGNLQTAYDLLNSSYNELISELAYMQNLMYVVTTAITILIAIIVYLVIRKPKLKP